LKNPINHKIAYILTSGIIVKLLVDTTSQIFNPFLTIIASGMGISVVFLGGLVGLRSLLGLSAPLFGSIADRIGYRKVMQVCLFLTGSGMLLIGLSESMFLFITGIILTGFGQGGFVPNIQAYISSKMPYHRRALGIGMLEYSWALASMIGLLAAGFLIEEFTWRTPFIFIGILIFISWLFLFTLPVSEKKSWVKNTSSLSSRISNFIHLGSNAKSAWGTIIIQGFTLFSIMHLLIIHGGWLIDEYALSPSALGKAALIMGFTDLSASISVSLFVDKLGKKRSVAIGLTGLMMGFILLPFFNQGIIVAIIGLIIPRTFFEFALVSNIALVSEQVPEQRGKVLSLSAASGLLGTTAAVILGPISYYNIGISGLSVISLISAIIAFMVLIFLVKEKSI
jgi:predicted MFS family arabinose efflux permease